MSDILLFLICVLDANYGTNRPHFNINVLSLDSKHVFIESGDDSMADLLLGHGMIPIRVPFQSADR